MQILAIPLGFIMEWIYKLLPSYGWALLIFTLVTRVLMFPLSIKQQKSSARMAAYQPMMKEIQNKWAKDKQRMNEEMMKFQQESGMSMTAGCLPMLVNMLVLFGLIEVIYRPMQYIMRIPAEAITLALEKAAPVLETMKVAISSPYAQNSLINVVKADPAAYASIFGDKLDAVTSFNTMFMGMDISHMPEIGFNLPMLLPVLAVVTMIASQVITMKVSGQEMQGTMKYMPWIMSIMFGYFCFTVPVGFSLYYTASNVLMLVQSLILKKMYDPEKMKLEVAAEIEAKRAEKKQKKQVVVKTESGEEVAKNVTEAELARLRLAKAREIDASRYDD